MRTVALPGGETVPALGQGTWYIGERRGEARREQIGLHEERDAAAHRFVEPEHQSEPRSGATSLAHLRRLGHLHVEVRRHASATA